MGNEKEQGEWEVLRTGGRIKENFQSNIFEEVRIEQKVEGEEDSHGEDYF